MKLYDSWMIFYWYLDNSATLVTYIWSNAKYCKQIVESKPIRSCDHLKNCFCIVWHSKDYPFLKQNLNGCWVLIESRVSVEKDWSILINWFEIGRFTFQLVFCCYLSRGQIKGKYPTEKVKIQIISLLKFSTCAVVYLFINIKTKILIVFRIKWLLYLIKVDNVTY